MEVIYFYILFAVTTSLTAMYEIILPVLHDLKDIDPKNNLVEYKYVTYITFFLLGIISAPILLPMAIVPSFGTRFKISLLNTLREV